MAFTDGNTLSAADVAAVTGNSGFGSFGGDGAARRSVGSNPRSK